MTVFMIFDRLSGSYFAGLDADGLEKWTREKRQVRIFGVKGNAERMAQMLSSPGFSHAPLEVHEGWADKFKGGYLLAGA